MHPRVEIFEESGSAYSVYVEAIKTDKEGRQFPEGKLTYFLQNTPWEFTLKTDRLDSEIGQPLSGIPSTNARIFAKEQAKALGIPEKHIFVYPIGGDYLQAEFIFKKGYRREK